MRRLARLVAAGALVVAGGLTLPGGAAQAAACSGTSGVTVVIDYGASTTTSCVSGDPTSAMSALRAVATVVSPQRYPGSVVCRINGTPANDPCIQMPPASAYWAFFHATRGGSWTYSQSGVATYNPAPGTVLGFAFGSGGRPDTPPPAATSVPRPSPSSTPRPSTRPSAPSTPRATASTRPRASSSTAPRSTSSARGTTPVTKGGTSSAPSVARTNPAPRSGTTAPGSTATAPAATAGRTAGTTAGATADTTPGASGTATSGATEQSAPDTSAAAASAPDSGSPATLVAGIGLIGVVGAAAAYLTHRRRTHG